MKQNKRRSREFEDFVLSTLEEYERPLMRYASRMTGSDSEMARDAVQHVFLKLCEQSLESVRDRIGPWLYRVCRNRLIDEMRRHGNRSHNASELISHMEGRHPSPHVQVEQADLAKRLSCEILKLPDSERETLELWSHGFDHSEIASVTGRRRSTVRVHLHRALGRLKNNPEISAWFNAGEECPAVSKPASQSSIFQSGSEHQEESL